MNEQIEEMLGKVFVSVEQNGDALVFKTDTEIFTFEHYQDCCEYVYIESVVGELSDLVGEPMVRAEVATQDDPDAYDDGQWTFYKFATRKGYVDVRWYGSSNGYYSIGVDLNITSIN